MKVQVAMRGKVALCRCYLSVWAVLVLLALALPAAAAVEVTTFGPQRYDRLKGAPTIYTETFKGCSAADHVLLQVWNGDSKVTRITAAEILVNGREILAEQDFKKAVNYLERRITTRAANDLKIVLKSGDFKEPSFLRIAVLSNGCDTTPPTIFDLSPADTTLLATSRPLIAAAYSDGDTAADAAGIDPASVHLTLDGVALTSTATLDNAGIRYLPPADLSDGQHTATLEVADRAGNRASRAWSFFIDTTPPTITVSAPADQSLSQVLNVQISGTLSEAATLAIAGQPVALTGTAFDHPLLLAPGLNTILLTADDAAGNRGSRTLTLWADSTPPVVTLISPPAGLITNALPLTVSGTLSETAIVELNGLSVPVVGESFTTLTTLVEGENTLTATAVDAAGNHGSVTAIVILDTLPPQISVSTPLEQTFTNTPLLTVSGTLSEEVAGLTINGHSVIPVGTSFTLVDLPLVEGSNEIRIVAIDRAGNSSVSTRSITRDTIPPQLTITTPLSGTLLSRGTVEVQALADEPLTRAEINDLPALVAGQAVAYPNWPLTEGENLLHLVAVDRAGNHGEAQVTVVRDSTPPAPPRFTAPVTLTRNPQLNLSGEAEAGATVTLIAADGDATLAVVATDAQGAFVLPELTLAEGENRFRAYAVDAAGNRSLDSELLHVVLDTVAPQISITAPAPLTITHLRLMTVTGTLDDPTANLILNNQPVALAGAAFAQPVELAAGSNTLVLIAVDPAGNTATASVQVELDDVAPIVTVTAPSDGLLTRDEQVTIDGQISESGATVELNGKPLTVEGQRFSGVVELVEGENHFIFTAIDPAGNSGTAALSVQRDRTPPIVTIIAPPTAAAGETVHMQVSAGDSEGLALVETSAANRPFWALAGAGDALDQSLAYTLSPDLAPATPIVLALRGVDRAGNSATATTIVTVSAGPSGPGYLQGEAYDDGSGLRLAGVTVRVKSAGTSREVVTAEDGAFLFELAGGDYGIELARAGYSTVYREIAVRPEQTVTPLDGRLTKLAPALPVGYDGGLLAAPLEAGPAWSGTSTPALSVALPAGALSESLDAQLTPLSSQGLPASLPRGWSPLAALDLRFTAAGLPLPEAVYFFFPATLRLPLGDSGLAGGDELVVVRFDTATQRWLAQGAAVVSNEGTSAEASLGREGIYALILADPAPLTPPAPLSGEALAATSAGDGELIGWQVDGEVAPPAAPPSLGLRVVGEVRLLPGAELPAESGLASGLVLRGRVTESFGLFSGEVVQPADYVQDLLLYRTPCLSGAGAGRIAPPLGEGLRASFPITPSHQYTIAELLQGKVGIEIVPPEVHESGVLAGPDGALLLTADGIALTLPAGALERTVPVQLQRLADAAVAPLLPPGFALLRAVRIDLSRQTLQGGALLSMPLPAGFDPQRPVVLAQVFAAGGGERLRGVALLRPVGSLLTSVTNVGGVTLPGIRQGGIYCLLQSAVPLGLVRGTVRADNAQPFGGALVTAASGGLADLSAASGGYLLFAPLGEVHLTALDLARFDRGESIGTLPAAESVTLDLVIRATVPTVVALSPEPGSTRVEPTARLVVTFSEPIDRATLTDSTLTLTDASGKRIAGVFSFSPDATVVTFYPAAALQSETLHTVVIGAGVRDRQGYPLATSVTADFTVRDTTPPPPPPAGSITATFPDAEGMITVTATQGSAAYDDIVLLINDVSGEIVSITPQGNGSFSGRISGQLGDEIQVVLMDVAGNRTLISYLTFTAPDGRTLVTARGGKVAGEGGLLLDIPAGALVGPTVIKITPVFESALPHPVPASGKFLGAVNIDSGGVNFLKEVKVSIPLPENLPAGAFVYVTQPKVHVNPDGSEERVYVVIDSTKIVDGRLSCASPPFEGIMGDSLYTFLMLDFDTIGVAYGTTYRDMDGDNIYTPGTDQPIRGAVIRCATAESFISYSGVNGNYAATLVGPAATCNTSVLTATHPLTMQRVSRAASSCPGAGTSKVDLKLADKGTVIPDATAPAVSLALKVAAGQTGMIVAGTVPVGTELEVAVSAVDQDLSAAYLTATFQTPEMATAVPITPGPTLNPVSRTLHTPMQGESPALFRYDYQPQFSSPLAGSTPASFRPDKPGVYKLTVEAVDVAGNRTPRTVQVRAINQGDESTSRDGVPRVDSLLPADGAVDVMITTQLVVWFSEPVENVTLATFTLTDLTTGATVPAFVYTNIEGGRMLATLVPQGNLSYARNYRATLSSAIRDIAVNPTGPVDSEGRLHLEETSIVFTTKTPRAFDLSAETTFSGGRDIDLYTPGDESGRTYAYVTAGWSGWRVIDVTDPTRPTVVHSVAAPPNWNFRGISVEPQSGTLGMTLNITNYASQYAYIEFRDLAANPVDPPLSGHDLLASAYSGIPGRLDLDGNYAYIATVVAGLQVVDIGQASDLAAPTRGQSIVGGFDSGGQGYGEPSDAQVYGPGKLLVTTSKGYLLLLSIASPAMPQLSSAFRPDGYQATRAAAVSGYQYNDADGNPVVIDLAVTSGIGQLYTVNLSDPANPEILGRALDENGAPAIVSANDITINKEAGLVFVTTYSSVQVFDIKDPLHPKRLANLTQLPDENGTLLPLGSLPALIEKDGWVYLANETGGMRVVDFDPVTLGLYCEEEEGLAGLSHQFCKDYYPALGTKKIYIFGRGADGKPLRPPAKLIVANPKQFQTAGFEIASSTVPFNDQGIAVLSLTTNQNYPSAAIPVKMPLAFLMQTDAETASRNGDDPNKVTTVTLNVRTNANVSFQEVLDGQAVYVADDGKYLSRSSWAKIPPETREESNYKTKILSTDLKNVSFDFVQELINQVAPRKRSASAFKLIDEDGQFDMNGNFTDTIFDTGDALKMLREQFHLGDTKAEFTYNPITGLADFAGTDDTSPIFRKLMKDYGQRAKGADEVRKWLHKVVEKETLVGSDADYFIDAVTDEWNPLDQTINSTPSDGTGLYELYVNVVKRFVDGMIAEAERYAGLDSPAPGPRPIDQWYSRGSGKTNAYGPDSCVTTGDNKECDGEHGTGMSYSYGGKQDVGDFNGTVSAFKAPPNAQYNNLTLIGDYRGNLYTTGAKNDAGVLVEGKIGATTAQKKWPGLYEHEYTYKTPSPYYMTQWAGIDCSGLVIRSLRYAKQGAIVSLGDICTVYNKINNVCDARTGIDTGVGLDTNVSRFFNDGNKGGLHFYFKNDKKQKIHRGDTVQYGKGHISIVYSERWGVSMYKVTRETNYDIIHAYGGGATSTYNEKINGKPAVFARKVMVTGEDISSPTGFGRITLWE